MSGKIFENLTAIDVYIENKRQKVIKCKGKVSGDERMEYMLEAVSCQEISWRYRHLFH